MKRLIFILLLFQAILSNAATYYVATNGNDNASGDITHPWATWHKAFMTAVAGDIVYFRGGVYYKEDMNETDIIPADNQGHSGTPGAYISYFNYPGEVPILDCSHIVPPDPVAPNFSYNGGIYIDGANYLHFKGLVVQNVYQYQDNVLCQGWVSVSCKYHIYENVTVRNISGRGFYYSPDYAPDTTYFINCDFYNCVDSFETGGYPGGWGDGINGGNEDNSYLEFDGCRVWNASDDGFNLWGQGLLVVKNCWAFNNGKLSGDGCGFKMNVPYIDSDPDLHRIFTNNLSAYNIGNTGAGFTENNNGMLTVESRMYNNTSYHNMTGFTTIGNNVGTQRNNVYRNNIAYANSQYNDEESQGGVFYTNDHNSWNTNLGVTVTNADFVSLDTSALNDARQEDGSLPATNFLKLASGSDLIDKGIDVGLPFNGTLPDLGYAEYGEYAPSDATNITGFTLSSQTGVATINSTNHTVSIEVEYGTSVTSLSPTITISYGATVDPASGASVNFTSPQTYTVTAEDETTEQVWTITVTVAINPEELSELRLIKSSTGMIMAYDNKMQVHGGTVEEPEYSTATDIVSFSITDQIGSTVNATNHTVVVTMPYGTNVTSLTPTITLSTGASIDPGGGSPTNFTSPVTYTVTAEDAVTEQEWTASVTVEQQGGQIIADHTVINAFDNIPAFYINEVKKMMVGFYGESHASGYPAGMVLLEATNSTYDVNVATGESYTDQHLRVENSSYIGEDIWFTWYAYPIGERPASWKTTWAKDRLSEYNSDGHPLTAIGFGWCADMTSSDVGHSTNTDPVLGVHWYGRSADGPEGSRWWGLDADDYSVTGNSVNLTTYFGAMEELIDYCTTNDIPTKVIFTTGPVDELYGEFVGEAGYQGELKHQAIRDYVAEDATRILFDYADILSYDNDGTPTTQTWNGHTYPKITDDNSVPTVDAYHISEIGAIRLAKAQWWMLARMAGWDGN